MRHHRMRPLKQPAFEAITFGSRCLLAHNLNVVFQLKEPANTLSKVSDVLIIW